MRINGLIGWDCINDEHRITSHNPGYEDSNDYIDSMFYTIKYHAANYRRCTAQNQENYIEVWIEKQALFHIVRPVVDKYCRRLIVTRGFDSITYLHSFKERAEEAMDAGQNVVVLYYGDWDPSGEAMIYGAMQTLYEEMDMPEIQFYRGAINPSQFRFIKSDPVPIKASDTRAAQFVKRHGKTAYELDAFHPQKLKDIVEEDIKTFTDIEVLSCELSLEDEDRMRNMRYLELIEKAHKNFKRDRRN